MRTLFSVLSLALVPLSLLATPSESETRATLRSLNSWSPVESAAAHGITGFRIGAGVTSFAVPEASQATFAQDTGYTGPKGRILFPKLQVTKGLWYPFDIGLGYGQLQHSDIRQVGGYLQWTLYEGLAQPAFALRSTYSRIQGLQTGVLESGGLHAVTSWGVPFVTLFASYGAVQTRGTVPVTEANAEPTSQTWWQPEANVGVNLTLLPPFVVLGVEATSLLNTGSKPTLQAKLSIGL